MDPITAPTSSFAFLAPYGPLYLRLATVAERALALDPSLTLVSLRQLSEAFARHAAARAGLITELLDPRAQIPVDRLSANAAGRVTNERPPACPSRRTTR